MQVIAGPPGSMKTLFMLNIVNNLGPKVPTLYHSSDSDDFTVASRVLAMRSGMSIDDAEVEVFVNPDRADKILREFGHVKWSFSAGPDLNHIVREAEAFQEVHGTFPHHTVIDILSDVDCEGVAEYNYHYLMTELKTIAREQNTSFTLVHHTSESAKGGSPPPRSALIGKISRLPTLVLSLWGDSSAGTLDVAVVKNRFGPQDAMAEKFFTMKAEPSVCKIEEIPRNENIIFRDGPSVPDDEKVNPFNDLP